MKKTLIIAAAALVSASAFSQTVSSANVVGYIKQTTPAAGAYTIASLGILGTNDTVDIQQAVANKNDLNASTVLANADKVIVWTGSGYNTYGLFNATTNKFWMLSTANGWVKAAQALPSSATITRGNGVWFATGTGGVSTNLMTAGEVPNDGTYNVTLSSSYGLIAYPYAATINLTNLVVANAAASTALASADKVIVWTGSGYTTYGLFNATTNTFWMVSTANGWVKAAQALPTSADLNLGKGMWYESPAGAKTIGFTQNYTIQ